MFIETIRLSKRGRDQLINLKRKTGIANWNILCRWAFCISLAEPTAPRDQQIRADSSLEMGWRTFGGQYEAFYAALLKERCKQDGLELTEEVLAKQLRLHLHRGIAYLAGDREVKNIVGLVSKAVPLADAQQSTETCTSA